MARMSDPSQSPSLLAHVERWLGPIARGHIYDELQVHVVQFNGCPFRDAVTYSTLGLSRHILPQPFGTDIRLELLFGCYSRYIPLQPESVPAAVAKIVLESHKPLVRGQVIGPAGPIMAGASVDGFYCSSPSAYPDELAEFEGSEPVTVFVWLIPITHDEIHYVWEHGWSAFEDLLVVHDPDVWNLERSSMVPPAAALKDA
jgi:suppressor of fused protein SUFU